MIIATSVGGALVDLNSFAVGLSLDLVGAADTVSRRLSVTLLGQHCTMLARLTGLETAGESSSTISDQQALAHGKTRSRSSSVQML